MFQRRHFEKIADVLDRAIAGFQAEGKYEKADAAAEVAFGFVEMLAADNPAFDRERFRRACGLWPSR